jgi:hypothetical protein
MLVHLSNEISPGLDTPSHGSRKMLNVHGRSGMLLIPI